MCCTAGFLEKTKKHMCPLWGFEWKFRYIFYPIFWTDHQTLSVCGHCMDDATIKLKPYKAIALMRPEFGLILAQFIKLSKKKKKLKPYLCLHWQAAFYIIRWICLCGLKGHWLTESVEITPLTFGHFVSILIVCLSNNVNIVIKQWLCLINLEEMALKTKYALKLSKTWILTVLCVFIICMINNLGSLVVLEVPLRWKSHF